MKKIYKRIVVCVIFIGVYSGNYCGETKKAQHDMAFESGVSANNMLSTLLINADLLLQQITNKTYDKVESQKYLKEINAAQAKLSSELYNAVKPHVHMIEQEFKKYSKLSQPARKDYDQTVIKKAFKALRRIIKNAANDAAELVVMSAQETIQRAIAHAEKVTTQATATINNARMRLAQGEVSSVEVAKIIGEQHYIVESAEKELQHITLQSQKNVESVDAQASYLSKFAKGVYTLGQTALTQTQLKLGLDYTQEEKDIAQAVMAQLDEQMAIATVKYKETIQRADLDIEQKAELDASYNQTMEELNNERYQQQLITGEVMNFNRKLFWGAVAAAGATVGAYVAYQYLNGSTVPEGVLGVQNSLGVMPRTETDAPRQPVTISNVLNEEVITPASLETGIKPFDVKQGGEGYGFGLPEYRPSSEEVKEALQDIKQPLKNYGINVISGELPTNETFSQEAQSAKEELGALWQYQPAQPPVAPQVSQGNIPGVQLDQYGNIKEQETKSLGQALQPVTQAASAAVQDPRVIQTLSSEPLPGEEDFDQLLVKGRELKETVGNMVPQQQPEVVTSPISQGKVRANRLNQFGNIIEQPTKPLGQGLQEARGDVGRKLQKAGNDVKEFAAMPEVQSTFGPGQLPNEQDAQASIAEGNALKETIAPAVNSFVEEAKETRRKLQRASQRAQKNK